VSATGVALDAIERRRKEEQQEANRRIGTLGIGSARDMAVTAVVTEDSRRRFDTYRELSEVPGVLRRISFLPASTLIIVGSAVALLILAVVFSTSDVLRLFTPARTVFLGLFTTRYAVLALAPLLIVFVLWRNFNRIDRFFAFSKRVLRELYVKEAPEEQLVRASNILQNALDFHGPHEALAVAKEQLRKTFEGLDTL